MELTIDQLKQFIKDNYLKNRTIVTSDIATIFDDMERISGLPIIRHKFHTGEDHGTWVVPQQWDIRKAWLKGPDGKRIASYADHPLFVSPYSGPCHLKLQKDELIKHIVSEPKQPDAYAFNWRYASDARLQLKDWGLSLPHNVLESLEDGEYELLIDVDVSDGDMLVGEIVVRGSSEESVIFIANYCHPGQVNDSFSGLVVFLKVMHELAQRGELKYTYRFIFCQETIGSAIYIASDPSRLDGVVGAMFSEMVGWGKEWFIKLSRRDGTIMDKLARESCRHFPHISTSKFYSLIGNDEYILDSVQVGIPTLSLQKYDFIEYHTSNDEPSHIVDGDLAHAVEITLHMVDVLEKDSVYQFTNPVPFWMTRFDLYADDQYEPEDFLRNLKIVYNYLDGKKSILDISEAVDCDFNAVFEYIQKMQEFGLVRLSAST